MDFVTQGPENDILTCSAATIADLYPESTFYIYDGGLTSETRNELSSFSNTKIIDWQSESEFDAPLSLRIPAQIETLLTNNKYITHIGQQLLGYSFPYKAIQRDHYVRQKPKVIRDVAERADTPLVWLDHDAIVLEKFDEVYDYDFDIGATARSRYEERDTKYSEINTGVMIFNCKPVDIQAFVDMWMATIDNLAVHNSREQEAIARLFTESNPEIFNEYYTAGSLDIESTTLQTRTFPCWNYNYYRFEECGINPSENKILHFKAGKSASKTNQKLIKDIQNGDISNWHRWHN